MGPPCKVSVSGGGKLSHSAATTSPLPSRAIHSSPLTSHEQQGDSTTLSHISHHRKHSSKSLSQPTIPEEGPEHSEWDTSPISDISTLSTAMDKSNSGLVQSATTQSITNKIFSTFSNKSGQAVSKETTSLSLATPKSKSESKVCKNLSTELGARAKDTKKDEKDDKIVLSTTQNTRLKKSGSFREEKKDSASTSETFKIQPTFTSYISDSKSKSPCDSAPKSPKLSRTESMTERTVQKISKVIRGTSRSESRSKKTRESSLSPSKKESTAASIKEEKKKEGSTKEEKKKEGTAKEEKKKDGKDEKKKPAHEKREIYKTQH